MYFLLTFLLLCQLIQIHLMAQNSELTFFQGAQLSSHTVLLSIAEGLCPLTDQSQPSTVAGPRPAVTRMNKKGCLSRGANNPANWYSERLHLSERPWVGQDHLHLNFGISTMDKVPPRTKSRCDYLNWIT